MQIRNKHFRQALKELEQVVEEQGDITINFDDRYKPFGAQLVLHRTTTSYPLIGGAIRGGKSYGMCAEGFLISMEFPGSRGFLCRHENSTFMTTTYDILMRLIPEHLIKHHDKRIRRLELFTGTEYDSIIYYGGLKATSAHDEVSRIKSMDLNWFGIDEASDTSEKLFLFLCSRLNWIPPSVKVIDTASGKRMVREYMDVDGNYKRKYFYYKGICASNPEPGWIKMRWIDRVLDDHIYIPALPTNNPYLPPGYLEKLRKAYPENWVKKYLDGLWEDYETDNKVYPYRMVKQAKETEIIPGKNAPREWGVDVARYGDDKNIVAERTGTKVRIIYESSHESTMLFVTNIVKLINERDNETKPDLVRIDTVGVGAGVYDRLEELQMAGDFKYKVSVDKERPIRPEELDKVEPGEKIYKYTDMEERDIYIYEFMGGWSSTEPERFNNFRSEVHWKFREDYLEKNCVDLPDDDIEMEAEFVNLECQYISDKRILVETKEQLKKRGYKSPNKLDAILIAFFGKDEFTAPTFHVIER